MSKFTVAELDRCYHEIRLARADYKTARKNLRQAADNVERGHALDAMRTALARIERAAACLHVDAREESDRVWGRMA